MRWAFNRKTTISSRREKSTGIQSGRFFLENRFLRVDVHPNGTLSIHDKGRDVRYRGLHLFEDGGDVGEPDLYCSPVHDRKIVSKSFPVRLSLVENESAIRIRVRMKVPVSVTQDRQMRSSRKGLIKIWSIIHLEENSRNLTFETVLDNQANDHRLRVLFPTDCDPKACRVEATHSGTKRNPVTQNVSETPSMTQLITIQNDSRFLSLWTENLYDHELKLDNRRTLCLTLLRGVGRVLQDIHSVPPVKIPNTQIHGYHLFRYALSF